MTLAAFRARLPAEPPADAAADAPDDAPDPPADAAGGAPRRAPRERLYLQQMLYAGLGERLVRDFSGFRWDVPVGLKARCGWGDGDTIVPIEIVTEYIVCATTPKAQPGPQNLLVSLNGQDFDEPGASTIVYHHTPSMRHCISPTSLCALQP